MKSDSSSTSQIDEALKNPDLAGLFGIAVRRTRRKVRQTSRPLSGAQIKWLEALSQGRDPTDSLRTRSEFGGAAGTQQSLRRRGFIGASNMITDTGRAALKAVNDVLKGGCS